MLVSIEPCISFCFVRWYHWWPLNSYNGQLSHGKLKYQDVMRIIVLSSIRLALQSLGLGNRAKTESCCGLLEILWSNICDVTAGPNPCCWVMLTVLGHSSEALLNSSLMQSRRVSIKVGIVLPVTASPGTRSAAQQSPMCKSHYFSSTEQEHNTVSS